ncbi:MAG TPA: prepilin peptidase [Gemmatimonadales bacterium]|nr:prepilin peptidase [Gemmatimonadales bacterium]
MDQLFVILLAGAFGAVLGSFLNVCVYRIPAGQSIVHPRSRCPSCKQPIAWRDNIPIVSWLVLRGRCRWCLKPISVQYPLVEAIVALVWAVSVLLCGPSAKAVTTGAFGTVLLGIGLVNTRTNLIPDEFTLGGLVVGLALSLTGGQQGFVNALIGAAAGFALLSVIDRIAGFVFKDEGIGGSSAKMMAMVGSFVGWRGVLLTIIAAVIGSVLFVPLSLKKKRLLPFGVFLAVGAAVAFVFGDAIIAWYGHFLKGD